MPISSLPESTVRRLASTLVITSPVLLLKELLDNAIDSGATSIDVLVSPNTVDRLEVRDNGHGISPDDFDGLGRPGHTSKLRSFDELGTLGGSTLGFRGTALASANALADVSLTTRVSTEHVATIISLAKGGGVASQRHVGAPVGTTVTVTGLFSHLPVRSQVAMKEAPKSLAKMKELLQSYALTRPGTKFRFTVLKTPNLSWSYAPAASGDVKEAAMQLFGIELTSQCTFETVPSGTPQEDIGTSDTQNGPDSPSNQEVRLVFEALLPKPGADSRKIAKGAFFSVDSRPVSPTRGTAKKLLSIFKKRIGEHFAPGTPRDPFIRLNIRCPPGSYDVNVEPSKDDVIFREEHHVLDQFESFLSFVYSTPEGQDSPQQPTAPERCDSPRPPITTVTNVAEAPTAASTPAAEVTSEAPDHRLPPQDTAPSWRVDMSSGLDGMSDYDGNGDDRLQQWIREKADEALLATPEDDADESSGGQPANEGLNPWSIAKLTATSRRADPVPERHIHELQVNSPLPPSERSVSARFDEGLLAAPREIRPRDNPEHQPSRQGRRRNPASQGRSLEEFLGYAPRRAPVRSTRPLNRHGQPRGNRGLQSPPTSSPHEHHYDDAGQRERPRRRYEAGSGHLVQSQISFGMNTKRKRNRNQVDMDLDQQPPEPFRLSRRARDSASANRLELEEANLMMSGAIGVDAQGMETISEAPRLRQRLPSEDTGVARGSTEARAWEAPNGEPAEPNMPTDDSRAQLIKQQCLMTQNPRKTLKRLKTEQLPLETIPRDSQTCTLLLTIKADGCALAQLFSGVSQFDAWLADGKLRGAFEDGTDPESLAMLVEPLLERAGQAITMMA